MGGSQIEASPGQPTQPHAPPLPTGRLGHSQRCGREPGRLLVRLPSFSAGPASGSKSTTPDWTSEVTGKLADHSVQGQGYMLEFLEFLTTKDAAAWANLCSWLGATLLAPKTLALEGEAGSPLEVEGHRDGEGNLDEPTVIAQDADERDDEPNDEDGDDREGNGDIAGGNANAAGVILPQLEIESLVAGTAEGDHGDLNDRGDVLRRPLPKTDRKIRHDRELDKAIKYARRRQHAMIVGVRFKPAAAVEKVGSNIVWALERPRISVFNRGAVHAKDGNVLDAGVTSGIRTKDRQVDFLFAFKMSKTTWTAELSYDDIKDAWEYMHMGSVRLGGYRLPWGQPRPSQMTQYLEDVLNSAPTWHAYSSFLVEMCGLRTPYDMSPALQVHFPKFPAPYWYVLYAFALVDMYESALPSLVS